MAHRSRKLEGESYIAHGKPVRERGQQKLFEYHVFNYPAEVEGHTWLYRKRKSRLRLERIHLARREHINTEQRRGTEGR